MMSPPGGACLHCLLYGPRSRCTLQYYINITMSCFIVPIIIIGFNKIRTLKTILKRICKCLSIFGQMFCLTRYLCTCIVVYAFYVHFFSVSFIITGLKWQEMLLAPWGNRTHLIMLISYMKLVCNFCFILLLVFCLK